MAADLPGGRPPQDNEFTPSRFPEPAFPGERPPVDPLAVETPRGVGGVPLPEGGPQPPVVDPQPGRVVTPLDGLPDPGDHAWEIRFLAPGLDLTAIDKAAEAAGHLPALATWYPHDPFFRVGGEKDAGGTLSEFMAYAFASSFDQVAKHAAGKTPLLDHKELMSLLAFAYACCVRLNPGEDIRPLPRQSP